MFNSTENWKPLPRLPKYLVSDSGKVIGQKGTVLKPSLDRRGYLNIQIYGKDFRKSVKVHRVVMEAFIGESNLQVNHKNGIKTDNRLNNLEYVTLQENIHHYFKYLKIKGLCETEVVEIKELLKAKCRLVDIARKFGVSPRNISLIRDGKIWKQV